MNPRDFDPDGIIQKQLASMTGFAVKHYDGAESEVVKLRVENQMLKKTIANLCAILAKEYGN